MSLLASAVFYALVPSTTVFVATSAVLLLGAALALRHRAEPTLVVVLVAGFLNPVVLATGQDRPAELFGYLFLLTSVAQAVALRRSFRIVPWLALAGVVALFGGWYGKFFDAGDQRIAPYADVPPAELVGAYHELHTRLVPLVAVLAFTAMWSLLALALRVEGASVRGREPPAPRLFAALMAVAAMVLGPARPRALLPARLPASPGDHRHRVRGRRDPSAPPPVRDGASGHLDVDHVRGAAGRVRGGSDRLGRSGARGRLERDTRRRLAARRRRRESRPSRRDPSEPRRRVLRLHRGTVLYEAHPTIFGVVLAFVGGFIGLLGARSRQRWLGLVAAALGALALLGAGSDVLAHVRHGSHDTTSFDAGFLVGASVWAIVQLLVVRHDSLRHRAPVSWTTTVTVSVTTLGFVAVVLASTAEDVPTLRALLTACAGIADLALGTFLLRAGGGVHATLLIGQALGLFATSLAFGFSGATVTVLWAALSAVAAEIAVARVRDGRRSNSAGEGGRTQRVWLLVTALLFVATLMHVASDAWTVEQSTDVYLLSQGRFGVLAAPVLANPRAYAFAGTGVALLFAARALARVASLRIPAACTAVIGYALLLALVVTEARAAMVHLPPPPGPGLDASEWAVFVNEVTGAKTVGEGSRAMMTTLLGAAAATALLGIGFVARDAFHRYLGLALFVLTFGKLALWDVWHVERIYQIVLLTGVGAFTVGGGFLYARFGARLLNLLKTGGSAAPPVILLAVLLAPAADARAEETAPTFTSYAQRRALTGIDAAGDYALPVDLDLARESLAEELFADLRIAGPDGAEVPYLVEETGALRPSASVPSRAVDMSVPGVGPVSATWAIADKGATHCRVALTLEGEDFLRRARVETGESPGAMTTVADGAYVYRIRQAGGAVAEDIVTYPPSIASLVRVTLWPDGPSTQVAIRGGDVSCAPAIADERVEWAPLTLEGTTRDAASHATVVTFDAGDRGIPIRALVLDVRTPEYSRRVGVEATNYRSLWPDSGSALVYRIEPRPGVVLASARIPISAVRKRYYRLRIADGDSAPLDVVGVKGEVRERRIVLRATKAGEHCALRRQRPSGGSAVRPRGHLAPARPCLASPRRRPRGRDAQSELRRCPAPSEPSAHGAVPGAARDRPRNDPLRPRFLGRAASPDQRAHVSAAREDLERKNAGAPYFCEVDGVLS